MTDERTERIYALAMRLLASSKEDKVVWAEHLPHEFFTKLGTNFAGINSVDADDRHPYRFFIVDPNDQDLGGISTAEVLELEEGWKDRLAELYGVAKRKGGRIDQALDSMFSALDRTENDIPF